MDWDAVAALAGVTAAVAAAWQLWRLRREALDARAAEIAGVSLTTTVVVKPTQSDVRDEQAVWVYEYRIENPGRLPISNVRAAITFPCEVQRVHHDGSTDAPARTLELVAGVVPPRSAHDPRRRTLLIPPSDWPLLEDAIATIAFDTPDAGRCVTRWPTGSRKTTNSLRRRLSKMGIAKARRADNAQGVTRVRLVTAGQFNCGQPRFRGPRTDAELTPENGTISISHKTQAS